MIKPPRKKLTKVAAKKASPPDGAQVAGLIRDLPPPQSAVGVPASRSEPRP